MSSKTKTPAPMPPHNTALDEREALAAVVIKAEILFGGDVLVKLGEDGNDWGKRQGVELLDWPCNNNDKMVRKNNHLTLKSAHKN